MNLILLSVDNNPSIERSVRSDHCDPIPPLAERRSHRRTASASTASVSLSKPPRTSAVGETRQPSEIPRKASTSPHRQFVDWSIDTQGALTAFELARLFGGESLVAPIRGGLCLSPHDDWSVERPSNEPSACRRHPTQSGARGGTPSQPCSSKQVSECPPRRRRFRGRKGNEMAQQVHSCIPLLLPASHSPSSARVLRFTLLFPVCFLVVRSKRFAHSPTSTPHLAPLPPPSTASTPD
jgi:hypothetical protein